MAGEFVLEDGELRAGLLVRQPGIKHGFGLRTSRQPPFELATVKQIHSARVLAVQAPGCYGEADALITDRPGLALSIKTADCLPILMADPTRGVVAAVHAGWRGTVGEIVPATIQRLQKMYGTMPAQLLVAIGPGIGRCCFEVGPEVAHEFNRWEPALGVVNTRCHIDLVAVNQQQLIDTGVPLCNIVHSGLCTVDRTDLFFSFRKERERAGRMLSWIALADTQKRSGHGP